MSEVSANQMHVPALRFPEFSGPWASLKFSNFLKPDFREVLKPRENYLAIGVRSHGKGTFQKPNSDPSKIAMESLFVVRENDLIVNITFAWEGAIAIVTNIDDGGLVSHRFPTYRFDESKVFANYFPFVIENRHFRFKLELISPGGAGRNRVLSKSEFLKLRHSFPSLLEQQKIAYFLGAVDARVGLLGRQRDALAAYKKAMMQRLFARTERFTKPNGSHFPDWQERRLEDLFDWISTNSLSREMLTLDGGEVQNIHYGDIHSKFAARFIQGEEVVPYVKPEARLRITNEAYCRAGDVVIADASEDYSDIGKVIEIIEVKPLSLIAGLHTYIARPKSEALAIGFSGYLFQTWNLRKQIMRIAQGISVLGISKPNLSKLVLEIPHRDEQRKIADFLIALDSKIDAVTDQIAAMKRFKQSLLQQMFV